MLTGNAEGARALVGELRAGDPSSLGRFRLYGRLGAGGMGQVFLGRDESGRWVAVKVIHEAHLGGPGFRERFVREIRIAGQVRAPWTVALVASDPNARRPWLATEYVPGPSLERAVDAAGPLPEASAGVLASRLADAVAALHSTGLLHRDLKPSNVMLAPDGPRLLDFGIARAMDGTRITHTGMAVGTPAFMSPEQARGEAGGPASDLFSLAAVLVFAATGRGPFGRGGNPVVMLSRVSEEEPDLAGMPERLCTELVPCLAKDPAERPSARQLAEALAHWADAAPPGAWPPRVVADLTAPPPLDAPGSPTAAASKASGTPPLRFDVPAGLTPTSTVLRSLTGLFRRGRRVSRAMLALLALPLLAVLALAAVLLVAWSGTTARPVAVPGAPITAPPAVTVRPIQLGAPTRVAVGKSMGKMAFSPDGGRVYVDYFGGIGVVDTRTNTLIETIEDTNNTNDVLSSPDGRVLYAVGNKQLKIIDLADGRSRKTVPLRDGLVDHIALSKDGRTIAVLGKGWEQREYSLTVVDTVAGVVRAEFPLAGVAYAGSVVLSADGARAYVNLIGGPVVRVDFDTGRVQKVAVDDVTAIALSPSGREVYSNTFGGLITTLDSDTGNVIRRVTAQHSCCDMVVALDGQLVMTLDDGVQVVDPGTGKVLATAQAGIQVTNVAVAPDGRRIYVNNAEEMVSIAMKQQ